MLKVCLPKYNSQFTIIGIYLIYKTNPTYSGLAYLRLTLNTNRSLLMRIFNITSILPG